MLIVSTFSIAAKIAASGRTSSNAAGVAEFAKTL